MIDFRQIIVERRDIHKLIIHNPTPYPLLGEGMHGAIFKLTPDRCIKVFADKAHAEIEGNVYKRTKGSPIIPKLYEVGDYYIIMEYVEGPNLKDYLLKKGKLSKGTAQQILFLFYEMKKLEFRRIDLSLRHILVSRDKSLKIVDHYHAFTQTESHPVKFLRQLGEIGFLKEFFKHVSLLDMQLFKHWKEAMPYYFHDR